jgi:hypothetical protein
VGDPAVGIGPDIHKLAIPTPTLGLELENPDCPSGLVVGLGGRFHAMAELPAGG